MRKQNTDPSRQICKTVTDCKCLAPKKPGPRAVSCNEGLCVCDDPVALAVSSHFISAVAAIGNSSITKAVKDVAGTIAGTVLPPHMRAALKVALNALPDTGPSFLDGAKKKILTAEL